METVLEKTCAICKSDICELKTDNILKPVTQKGLETIIQFSVLRQEHNLTECLFFLSGFSFTNIHESQDCRGRRRGGGGFL